MTNSSSLLLFLGIDGKSQTLLALFKKMVSLTIIRLFINKAELDPNLERIQLWTRAIQAYLE